MLYLNMNTELLKREAQVHFQAKRLAEARMLFAEICRLDRSDVQAWHMLGAIHGMLGDLTEAERCCRQVIALRPDAQGAYVNLANVLTSSGRLAEAEACFRQALRLKPDDAQAHNNLGNLLSRSGRLPDAEASYREALKRDPRYAEAHNNLGALLSEQGRHEEAIASLRQAIALKPDYTDAWSNLGGALTDQLKTDEAEVCYRRALALDPLSAKINTNLGKLMQTLGRYDEAMSYYARALELDPRDVATISAKAALHERRREFEAANDLVRPIVARGVTDARLALSYASIARHRNEQREAIAALERALQAEPRDRDRVECHFALGDLLDELGCYDEAFAQYRQGNTLWSPPFDRAAHEHNIKVLMDVFSSENLARLPRSSELSPKPVFIVGMPRSGTSLTEQILASHPRVFGGGEMGDVSKLTSSLSGRIGVSQPYPGCVTALTPPLLDQLAREYLERLAKLAPDAERVTDKTPLHFFDLGFIQMLFPGARIIHCMRDPMDTCLSIYFHRFNEHHAYACDLANLGYFYRLYERVMQHWRSVTGLPLLELRYEDLVDEPERTSRALVEFCGLEWDDRCLRFYESKRDVNTPSYDQVRRPIYRASVARWKHYARHLEPLMQALNAGPGP
jgi:tetratricopeptide (TPR) repeat protein